MNNTKRYIIDEIVKKSEELSEEDLKKLIIFILQLKEQRSVKE